MLMTIGSYGLAPTDHTLLEPGKYVAMLQSKVILPQEIMSSQVTNVLPSYHSSLLSLSLSLSLPPSLPPSLPSPPPSPHRGKLQYCSGLQTDSDPVSVSFR